MSDDAPSLITTDIDYAREGIQSGTLRVPYSHDRSAYGHIPIPLMVAKHGDGPTVLLTGANHGDEYEGPIALMRLMRGLDLERLNGRLIVIPALNLPAYRAGTRTSPIDRVNLNRAFPGKRNGTPTEMIAHYVETVLMRLADYALDFHAGGSSLDYLPTLFAETPGDADGRGRMDRLIEAFGAPRTLRMEMLGEDRVIGSAARRNGVTFLTGEFGGGATVDLEGLAVLEDGLAGVLDVIGVLPRAKPRAQRPPTRRLAMKPEHYVFAPCDGIFEPAFRLGDEIEAGKLAGLIHDPAMPCRDPLPVHFKAGGLALCIRTYALVAAGDCLGHLASDEV